MDYKEHFHSLIDEGNFEDAFTYLKKFSGYAYEDPFYFANMGWLYNQFHDYESAKSCLLTGLRMFEDDGWMFAQLGCTYNRCMNFEKALYCFQQALKLDFDDAWIHYEMSMAYREQKDYANALEEIQNALLDAPEHCGYMEECGDLLITLERYLEAQDIYAHAYEISKEPYYQLMQAECLEKDQQFDQALMLYEKIKQEELVVDVSLHKGICLSALKQYAAAIRYLEDAQRLGRDDTLLYKTMGIVYQELDEHERSQSCLKQAFSYYERALPLNDDRRWIYQKLIELGVLLDNHEALYQVLTNGLDDYGDETWMCYQAARIYSEDEQYERSIAIIQETPEACYSEEFDYLLAHDLGRAQRSSEAIAVLEKLHNAHPYDSWVLCEYGWNLTAMEYYDLAIEMFEKLLEKEEDAYGKAMIGWCSYHLGEYKKALQYLNSIEDIETQPEWVNQLLNDCEQCLKKEG